MKEATFTRVSSSDMVYLRALYSVLSYLVFLCLHQEEEEQFVEQCSFFMEIEHKY